MGLLSLLGIQCESKSNQNVAEEIPFKSDTYHYDQTVIQKRATKAPIHPMIHCRRSRVPMDGSSVDRATLFSLFEAARWAPSSFNFQNWRFVYVTRDQNADLWPLLLECVWHANREWTSKASALVVVVSKRNSRLAGIKMHVESHSFDAGSAWMSMALEGSARGLVVHSIDGFDRTQVARIIRLPDNDEYNVDAVVAVGNPVKDNAVPETVTQRFDVQQIISRGVLVKTT